MKMKRKSKEDIKIWIKVEDIEKRLYFKDLDRLVKTRKKKKNLDPKKLGIRMGQKKKIRGCLSVRWNNQKPAWMAVWQEIKGEMSTDKRWNKEKG